MPTYAASIVNKPRRIYWCETCHKKIAGCHVVAFGTGMVGDPPYRVRLCLGCAERAAAIGNPKIAQALAGLAEMRKDEDK